MKKKMLWAGAALLASGVCIQQVMTDREPVLTELIQENVEALAEGEGYDRVTCYGTGSVDCPINHNKVYFIYYY